MNLSYYDEEDNIVNLTLPIEDKYFELKYQGIKEELAQYFSLQIQSPLIIFDAYSPKSDQTAVSQSYGVISLQLNMMLNPGGSSSFQFQTIVRLVGYSISVEFKTQKIDVSFRNCIVGEIVQSVAAPVNSSSKISYSQCFQCLEKTYSIIDPSSSETQHCNDCPINAQYCSGNILIPQDGYWLEPHTSNLLACSESSNCLVTITNQNLHQFSNCIEGAAGPLCESCNYSNPQNLPYGRTPSLKCAKCSSDSYNHKRIFSVASILIFNGVYQSYLSYQASRKAMNTLKGYYLKKAGIINFGTSLSTQIFGLMMKKLIAYLQLALILKDFKFEGIIQVKDILNFIGTPQDTTEYSLDCLMIHFEWTKHLEIPFIRLLWNLVNSLIHIVFALILVFLILQIAEKNTIPQIKGKIQKRALMATLIYSYFVLYPSLVRSLSAILLCQQIGLKYYIVADTQFKCNSEEHLWISYLLCLPLLLIIVLIIPLIIYLTLKSKKNSLFTVDIYSKYSFLFLEYNEKFYYWELVKMSILSMINIGINLFTDNVIAKGAFLSVVIIIQIRLTYRIQPYKKKFFNNLDQLSNFILLVCFQIGILNYQSENQVVKQFAIAGVYAINILFFFWAFAYVLRFKLVIRSKRIYSIVMKFSKKISKIIVLQESCYGTHKRWKIIKKQMSTIIKSSNTLLSTKQDEVVTSSRKQ